MSGLRALWALVVVPHVFASCVHLASPCSAFRAADFVGVVKVDAARHLPFRTESWGVVLKRYKGDIDPGARIAFYGGGVCYDAPGEIGATYVIFARRLPDGRYSTDCTRTHVLGTSPRDMDFLERYSSRPWLAAVVEPFGCNEQRLPVLVRRIWILSLSF